MQDGLGFGAGGDERAIGVAELTERVRGVLAQGFAGSVVVAGEVSGFRERNHWYFSLKERDAVVSCVCWSRDIRRLPRDVVDEIADGVAVVVTGRVDYYPPQGRLQLYVEHVELAGRGRLEAELERLKGELAGKGYFAVERKRALPAVPAKVAVVTSRSAAALRDVEQTARQRWAGCELVLADVRVQGAAAAGEVAAAIDWLSAHGAAMGVEVVMVVRGGGSLEDLWAFNERVVADAIFRCGLPVVTGVGHEPDVTVAQLVADVGAATPTQAAMAVVPDGAALAEQVDQWSRRLRGALRGRAEVAAARVAAVARRAVMREPGALLADRRRLVEEMERRLGRGVADRLSREAAGVAALGRQLEAVGPMAVLRRGYSLTRKADGSVVRSAGQVRGGERIETTTAAGRIVSVVGAGDAGGDGAAAGGAKRTKGRKTKRRKGTATDEGGLFGGA
ncbi:MAG: exodeoxyribonuclease VII large subunit [Planctomycetota bacterium]